MVAAAALPRVTTFVDSGPREQPHAAWLAPPPRAAKPYEQRGPSLLGEVAGRSQALLIQLLGLGLGALCILGLREMGRQSGGRAVSAKGDVGTWRPAVQTRSLAVPGTPCRRAAAPGPARTLPPLGAFMTDLLLLLGLNSSLGATAAGSGGGGGRRRSVGGARPPAPARAWRLRHTSPDDGNRGRGATADRAGLHSISAHLCSDQTSLRTTTQPDGSRVLGRLRGPEICASQNRRRRFEAPPAVVPRRNAALKKLAPHGSAHTPAT